MRFADRFFIAVTLLTTLLGARSPSTDQDPRFIQYVTDPKTSAITFYWRDANGKMIGSIQNLKQFAEDQGKTLRFAMNGGMYKPDHSPQGLFIENSVTQSPLDTTAGPGNFYLKPNGVFYLTTNNQAVICATTNFKNNGTIKYATQSGPMLLIDGAIHPAFKRGSTNLNIRNGVGILPDNRVIFVLSKEPVNFYDFAEFFKNMHCKNALYLDGFVSRAYVKDTAWKQLDGDFGVIIGVFE